MIRLVYSNRVEELLAELAGRVRAQQRVAGGALVPVRIVVPSASVERYVRLGIARVQGIAANVETPLLTRFAAQLAAPEDACVADADTLEAMALTLFFEGALLAEQAMAPIRAYLHAAGDAPEATDLRRVQLAARIGRIFEEYTYSRGDMLAAWSQGTTLEGRFAGAEGWQRRLWLAMFGPHGIAAGRSPRVVTLKDAIASLDVRRRPLPRALHVFGFAHVARTFHELFERLAQTTDVIVYSLSPCEGFWEDIDSREPAPVRDWGRAGREHVRALNALAGFDHDDRFVDPLADGSRTLLRQLQSDVLRREPARDVPEQRDRFAGDTSLVALEHANARREVEAIASEIWRLVSEDDSLRFDDIAVLVPPSDAAAYAVHFAAVFASSNDLPYQMGLPRPQGGRVAEAVELLFALPLGRFTRPELLRFLMHPQVGSGVEDADPARWMEWCEALGIVHGAERGDHAGTYIENDILNWDQGLRRLAVGAFMSGDASGERRPWTIAGDAYVPLEVTGTDLRDAATFGLLVRSLLADARFAREAQMTTSKWAAFLATLVQTYVLPPTDGDADELARCLRRIRSIAEVDIGDQAVSYRIASALALTRVAAGSQSPVGEGVVLTTLASVRPLPYRVIFACAMGEGRFPAPNGEDPLDLRWARRREGDVSDRDRDKYAFLELLLACRDKLYLSYVSRDPLTGDTLRPSSVVRELCCTESLNATRRDLKAMSAVIILCADGTRATSLSSSAARPHLWGRHASPKHAPKRVCSRCGNHWRP